MKKTSSLETLFIQKDEERWKLQKTYGIKVEGDNSRETILKRSFTVHLKPLFKDILFHDGKVFSLKMTNLQKSE
jgi:hypothetical protein